MSMNIENEETHRLARELAALTGESVTAAVTEALRERLERIGRERTSRGDHRYLGAAATLRDEPEAPTYARASEDAAVRRMSAGSFLEAAIVIDAGGDPIASRRLDQLLEVAQLRRLLRVRARPRNRRATPFQRRRFQPD